MILVIIIIQVHGRKGFAMKLKELVAVLKNLNIRKEFQDYEVYLSSDSEGNSYSTTDINMTVEVNMDGKCIILFPYEEGLDYEDLFNKRS